MKIPIFILFLIILSAVTIVGIPLLCDLRGYIHRYRTTAEIKEMNAEDIRNTIINEIHKATNYSIPEIQVKDNCQLHRMLDRIIEPG